MRPEMPTVPTELYLEGGSPATADVDAVVIGLVPGEDGPALAAGATEVEQAFDGELAGLLKVAGATGKADEVVRIPTRGTLTAPLLVAVGLGKADAADDGPSAEQVRRASGAAARALAGTARAVSTLGRLDLAAAAEGRRAACWVPTPSASTAPTATDAARSARSVC
jgi:leucyl aminopeptidase